MIIPTQPQESIAKQPRKRKEERTYPEITEKSISPEDECCNKVCTGLNDLIGNMHQMIKGCEQYKDYGFKGACYTRMGHDMDAQLRLRHRLAELGVCKCYEEEKE